MSLRLEINDQAEKNDGNGKRKNAWERERERERETETETKSQTVKQREKQINRDRETERTQTGFQEDRVTIRKSKQRQFLLVSIFLGSTAQSHRQINLTVLAERHKCLQ